MIPSILHWTTAAIVIVQIYPLAAFTYTSNIPTFLRLQTDYQYSFSSPTSSLRHQDPNLQHLKNNHYNHNYNRNHRLFHSSLQLSSTSSSSSSSVEEGDVEFVNANDGEALQALFEKMSDGDGLMTKDTLVSIPIIADLLSTGDLLSEEMNDIWDAAPKFPDVETSSVERIDVDSFIQVYRDIDDIFEDDDEKEDADGVVAESTTADELSLAETVNGASVADIDSKEEETDDTDNDDDDVTAQDEQELEVSFKTICDENQLVSKEALRGWNEIADLISDDMLSEDEFNDMWDRTTKSPGSADLLDVDGFLSFNVALDDLFEFDEDDEDDGDEVSDEVGGAEGASAEKPLFYADDLPPGVIFAELADDDYLMGMKELKQWGDLQDMLNDGDLLPIELQNIFDGVPKAPGSSNKINEEGFTTLFETIDALFEDDDEDDEVEPEPVVSAKTVLLQILSVLEKDEERLPCGLECTDGETQRVLDAVQLLERESDNRVISSGGDIVMSDISGDWEMKFTSSSTLKFNKGLSGLVPPNGKFGGLVQSLKASKYLADVEYVESINAGPASFDVRVTGDWELKNSVSLFTGERSVALSVEPDKVTYGLTSTRADHWKSLGPMNLLDITYLDEDLRIMRGTTSTDSIFIFQKI